MMEITALGISWTSVNNKYCQGDWICQYWNAFGNNCRWGSSKLIFPCTICILTALAIGLINPEMEKIARTLPIVLNILLILFLYPIFPIELHLISDSCSNSSAKLFRPFCGKREQKPIIPTLVNAINKYLWYCLISGSVVVQYAITSPM